MTWFKSELAESLGAKFRWGRLPYEHEQLGDSIVERFYDGARAD
jgi:hypothetical protein